MDNGVPFLGDTRDYSGYTGADALHTEVYKGSVQMAMADENVMTSISNNAASSENVALAKGKAAIIEEMNAGNTESDAQDALNTALNTYFTKIEENLFTHFNAQVEQLAHMMDSVSNHSNLSLGDVFEQVITGTHQAVVDYHVAEFDHTHPDGSVTAVKHPAVKNGNDNWAYPDPFGMYDEGATSVSGSYSNSNPGQIVALAFSDGSEQAFLEGPYSTALNDLQTAYDDANAALTGFVADVYAQYEPGDIPTEDLVDPITASTELAQNYDGYQAQGAHAAMLGIPTTAEQSVAITVHDSDGDKPMLVDIYTEHVPTDGSGNEIGFEAGTTYDPSSWSEPLYIAYEYQAVLDEDGNVLNSTEQESYSGETTTQTESDFIQLETSFTIDSITDKDGNDVQSFQTESQNTQTADVSKLQAELEQLREEQLRLQEEAQSGGGGLLPEFSLGGVPGVGVLAIAGGAVLLLFGQNDN